MSKKLIDKKCTPCAANTPPLSLETARELLAELDQWTLNEKTPCIKKNFSFKNFYTAVAFVNAVAWIAHRENHHPDLRMTYNTCEVTFSTHAIHGLSENDFICAKKIDQLL